MFRSLPQELFVWVSKCRTFAVLLLAFHLAIGLLTVELSQPFLLVFLHQLFVQFVQVCLRCLVASSVQVGLF